MMDADAQLSEPLQQAWRVALRWRTLGNQFAGVFLLLAVIALGCRTVSWFAPEQTPPVQNEQTPVQPETDSSPEETATPPDEAETSEPTEEKAEPSEKATAPGLLTFILPQGVEKGLSAGQWITWTITIFVAWLIIIETGGIVMGCAWAEYTGDTQFCPGSHLLKTLPAAVTVGGICAAVIAVLSIFPHCVLLLLTDTGWLGRFIFAVALVPMFIIAVIEVLLVLAAAYVFPPMLAEHVPGAGGALQSFLDAVIGCRLRDVGVRFRALITSALMLVPTALVAWLSWAYLSVLSSVADVEAANFADDTLSVWLTGVGLLAIIAAVLTPPLAYLNTACLMIHRATQE